MAEIIQQFFDLNLINLGTDDSQVIKLEETSQELAESLSANYAQIPHLTILGLNPDIPEDDLYLAKIESMLKQKSRMIRSQFSSQIRQCARAIAIQSLDIAIAKDRKAAALVWLTGSSALPYTRANKDQLLCSRLIQQAGEVFEKHAELDWLPYDTELDPSSNPSVSDINWKELVSKPVDQTCLFNELGAAAGPHGRSENRQITWKLPAHITPNPHSAATGDYSSVNPDWVFEFAKTASVSISHAISSANQPMIDGLNEHTNTIKKAFLDFMQESNTIFLGQMQSLKKSTSIYTKQTQLLWWKEALYSPLLKTSYRDLPIPIAMITLAMDLSSQISAPYPVSIDFFLNETARTLCKEKSVEQKTTLISIFELSDAFKNHAYAAKIIPESTYKFQDLPPLIQLLRQSIQGKNISSEMLFATLGVKSEQEISWADFSVWCFKSLQAQKLIEGHLV